MLYEENNPTISLYNQPFDSKYSKIGNKSSMYSAQIHIVFDQLISYFRRLGIWHGEDTASVSQFRLKLFCSIYLFLFVISLAIGAITQENLDESIFLAEISLDVLVVTIKMWILLWKQKDIMLLLNRICAFSVTNDENLEYFNRRVEKFIKVMTFAYATIAVTLGNIIFPFFGDKKSLILDIAFPLDWKNTEIGFWAAYIFFDTENILCFLPISFSVLIWYLLLHCSLRYEILGTDIRNMGRVTGCAKAKISENQRQMIFFDDLMAVIKTHLHLRGLTDELGSFLSKLFLLQLATGGLCICGSIYCLAFDIAVNNVERCVHIYTLFFNIAELFMITYLGHEILLSSGRLTYSLFESDWVDQPQSTKKCIIVFGEYLKQSHQLLIGKLYPLTLETFTRILNSSYSLFNILQNFKE